MPGERGTHQICHGVVQIAKRGGSERVSNFPVAARADREHSPGDNRLLPQKFAQATQEQSTDFRSLDIVVGAVT
jgi:hypothetical protein